MLRVTFALRADTDAAAEDAVEQTIQITRETETELHVQGGPDALAAWRSSLPASALVSELTLRPRTLRQDAKLPGLEGRDAWTASVVPMSYTAAEYASMYGFPGPASSAATSVAVLSFGGGMYGTIDAEGVLTASDCTAYWSRIGIPASAHPRVVVKTLYGATNAPAAYGTDENTLDVQMIGGCYRSSSLTIVLYIVPNDLRLMAPAIMYILDNALTIGGSIVKPSVISISWGTSEQNVGSSLATTINTALQTAATRGVPVCVASGDYGASNGLPGFNVDFPSSSPNVVACGGTTLYSPSSKTSFAADTQEIGWSNSGGGRSAFFARPAYQWALAGNRNTPDLALNADPVTGVSFTVNGANVVFGGTSIVAPAVAAFFALTRYRGFPHTAMYANVSWSRDVLSGNNGFAVTVGYDNVTGWGSIRGATLAQVLLAPPAPTPTPAPTPPPALPTPIPVRNIAITSPRTPTTRTRAGVSIAIGYSISPPNATNRAVVWTSSRPAVASVSSAGVVTTLSSGTAIISVRTVDGGRTDTLTCIVSGTLNRRSTGRVTGVRVRPALLRVKVGASVRAQATILPSTAANKVVSWSSNKPSVASVNDVTGVVTGVGVGTATILATTADGGYRSSCSVVVSAGVTSIRTRAREFRVRVNESHTLMANIEPLQAAGDAVLQWTAQHAGIVQIDPGTAGIATLRGLRRGATAVHITDADGDARASIHVSVV